jgi:hypothetical protein
MARPLLRYILCLLAVSICALAKDNPEQTQFGHDVRVEAGEKVGDVTCINCSVYIAGESMGEVTTVHGNVVLEPAVKSAAMSRRSGVTSACNRGRKSAVMSLR